MVRKVKTKAASWGGSTDQKGTYKNFQGDGNVLHLDLADRQVHTYTKI